ncbi:hypothetical protein TTRE_0000378401 [Trichuris trichiura]|uniref:Ig-like domain-containing protein n=1 Tax=Trichuris trichiura TaxID=36087 RepID=A0A077Z4T8_TRITR|nr:hypothetical protein TTRE_0000378401 [Trichuris trichiura]
MDETTPPSTSLPRNEGSITLDEVAQLIIRFLLDSKLEGTARLFAQRAAHCAETSVGANLSGLEMVTLVNDGIRYLMSLKNIPIEQFPKNCEDLIAMIREHRMLEDYYEFRRFRLGAYSSKRKRSLNLHSIQIEREISVFNRYHECVEHNAKNVKQINAVAPRLVTARERSIVRLHCTPCPNPRSSNPRRFWFYRLWKKEEIVDVPLASSSSDDEGFLLIEDFILVITEAVKEKHSGEYICTDIHGHPLSTYYVDIVPEISVEMIPAELAKEELEDIVWKDENLTVSYHWSSWTACNRCFLGERRRYAECTLKRNGSIPSQNRHLVNLFRLFPEGVPCYSSWVPLHLRQRSEVSKSIKMLSQFCTIDCPTEPPERIVTESGVVSGAKKVVEKVQRGFVSRDEELPPKPPPVFRQVHQVDDGGSIMLYCPHGNEEVYWQKEDMYLPTPVLTRYAKGRIYYTKEGHMVFTSTLGTDSGFYSCWRFDHVLLLSARLYVDDPRSDIGIRAAIISGGGVVFLTFTLIIACTYIRARPMKRIT